LVDAGAEISVTTLRRGASVVFQDIADR